MQNNVRKIKGILKKALLICLGAMMLGGFCIAVYVYGPWWFTEIQEYDYTHGSIAQIELPKEYERMPDDGDGFADYLRSLPLAEKSIPVRTMKGEIVDSLLPYTYCIMKLPLLHDFEQCADVCIRLRADYLFRTRQFWRIHFEDTQYHTMRYYWGGFKKKYLYYLYHVFKFANTESLIHEMPQRPIKEMQPGDIFVYCAKDREDKEYGHAIMVADVAIHPSTGKKIFLLLQGSTPACNMHILKNLANPSFSPWFELEENDSILDFGVATYKRNELRYFEN